MWQLLETHALFLRQDHGHTETVRYLVGLKDVDVNHKAYDDHMVCVVLSQLRRKPCQMW